MCTLALFRDVSPSYPLVVAANRDEVLDRPALPPALLAEPAGVVAGKDLEAGGTWLGCRVTPGLLVAGLLNRRVAQARPASSPPVRSRGLLCLDALGCRSVDAAVAGLADAGVERYAPFNLLLADLDRAVIVDNHDGLATTELAGGLSVLTNLGVNDPRCPRLASAHAGFARALPRLTGYAPVAEIVEALGAVLRDHEGSADPRGVDPFARVCVHAGPYGTRSSSIVLVDGNGGVRYFHADAAPCRAAFREVDWRGVACA
jgi:uncharacterized protein with NRDE domain